MSMKPHDDLAVVAAAPAEVFLDGRRYLVKKLTPRALGRLSAAVQRVVPDPRDKVRRLMEGLPDAVQIHMWQMACEEARRWPPPLGSPEATAAMLSPEGMAELLEVTIGPHVAGFDRAAAEALADRLEVDDLERILEAAAPGGKHAPKAPAAAPPSPGAS